MEDTTENNILEAAQELFLSKGYALTTTVEIAAKAGCNQALVHYYYRSKEQLFQRVMLSKIELVISSLTEVANERFTFIEKLRHFIEAHFDMLAANPKIPFFVINEMHTNPDRLRQVKEQIGGNHQSLIDYWQGELKRAIERGEIRPIAFDQLLLNIISANIAFFLAMPAYRYFFSDDYLTPEVLAARRTEVVTSLIYSLRP